MDPEHTHNKRIWWILQELKKEALLVPKNSKIEFILRNFDKKVSKYISGPDISTQRKLLNLLQNEGIINCMPVNDILRGGDLFNTTVFDITIKQPEFDKKYACYKTMLTPKITLLSQATQKAPSVLAMECIINGLFRNKQWHNFTDDNGQIFYISVLDELCSNDIELETILNYGGHTIDTLADEMGKITLPYIQSVFDKIEELKKDKWIEIKKIDIKQQKSEWNGKTIINGSICPGGYIIQMLIEIEASKIYWSKFIQYQMEEYEKSSLDLENIYSSTKQKTRLIQTINKKSKELEKERDLILSLDYGNSDNGRVKVLQILTELEQEKYIKINGFCVYPLTNNGFHSDSGIKVNLTMEKKLKNFIIKIEQEKAINTADNNNNNSFDKNDPYTFTKKNLGHFTIGKGTKSILIGKKDSRHFRLLQCLCEPHFGVEKTIEGIFEAIRKDKDNKKRDLQEYSPQSKNRKWEIITYAKKQLQKNKTGLQGLIKFKNKEHKTMWLEKE